MNGPIITVTLNPAIDQTVGLTQLRHGEVNIARSVAQSPGGKGVNVASCLADWGGAEVIATGILGQDNAGPFEALFRAKGIGDRFVRQPGATRVNIKIVSADDGATTDINLPGCPVAADTFARWLDHLDDLSGNGRLVALSGSLPGGLDDDCYATLLARLAGRGARVALDTSGNALIRALSGDCLPYCIKPNRHELEQWSGRPLPTVEDIVAEARALIRRGIGQVVVSLAERGALFADAEGAWLATPPPIRPASSVGAGDALLAGWLAARHAGLPRQPAIRQAMAFAAGKLAHIGPHLPPAATIRRLETAVSITRLPD